MAYKLTNKGPQGRVVYDQRQRAVVINPGESKTADLDEYTATTIHIDAANGDSLKIQPLGAKAPEPKAVKAAPVPARAPPPPIAETRPEPAPPRAPAEPVGEPEEAEASQPPSPSPKASRRAPVGRSGAKGLLREAEAGLNFFELRRRAKELLGEDWPGGHATKAEIIDALERRG